MDLETKQLCDKLYYLAKKKKTFSKICEELGLKDYEITGLVYLMKQEGYNIDYIDGEILFRKNPPKHQDVYQLPNNLEHLKLLLISDTHLGSKYDRLDILKYLYGEAEDRNVQYVLHSGDFTDGRSNRPEQVY